MPPIDVITAGAVVGTPPPVARTGGGHLARIVHGVVALPVLAASFALAAVYARRLGVRVEPLAAVADALTLACDHLAAATAVLGRELLGRSAHVEPAPPPN